MRWTRTTIAAAAIVLAVVLFFAVNIVSQSWLSRAKLDLTSVGLYSLSEGTRNTLRNLPENITLRFFFSEEAAVKYAQVRAYGQRVRDLLREYEALSGGKLKLEIIDPEPLTEQEDVAVAQGVTGAPTPSGEKIYFGLVGTNQIDGREVIPFFIEDREEYLEYDLTSLIYRLIREKKPKIGVVSNLPFDTGLGGMMAAMQGRSRPFMIYEQLRESYDVQFLEQDFDRVPTDIDVVMIAHPKVLNDKTQYALDQFIMRGGRALVFLDPWSELSQLTQEPEGQPLQGATGSSTESIPQLLKSWGVSVDGLHVIGVGDRAQQVVFGQNPIEYVVWIALRAEDMNRSDPITGELTDLNLGSVGAITQTKGATTKFEPLVQTTKNSMEIEVPKINRNPNPDELLRDFVSSGEQFVVAARITGTIKSAFAKAPAQPPAAPGTEAPKPLPPHLSETKQPANIILVADSDIFTDNFWVQAQELQGQRVAVPVADNSAFVLNAIENLTGSNELISLRSRGTSNRPFTEVNKIRMRANANYSREEKRLLDKLQATQNRLAELEGRRSVQPKPGATSQQDLLTPEQQAEIEKFRIDLVETRSALREVQYRLRRDIDRLGNWLAAINILLVPLMLAGTAITLALLRRRKPKTGGAAS